MDGVSDLTQRLDEIQARADAATEGPWDLASLHVVASGRYDHDDDSYWVADTFGHETTGHFIASARTDVPWLVDLARRQDAALRAVLDMADDWAEGRATLAEHEGGVEYCAASIRGVIAISLGVTQ